MLSKLLLLTNKISDIKLYLLYLVVVFQIRHGRIVLDFVLFKKEAFVCFIKSFGIDRAKIEFGPLRRLVVEQRMR
jgi:hypothetical protein